MLSSNWMKASLWGTFAATGVATLLALGGCPVAQVPTLPPTDSDANTSTGNSGNTNTGGQINRPIPPPPAEPNNDSSSSSPPPSGGTTPPGTGGGTNPGSGTGGTIFLRVNGPGDNIRVRPGAIVNAVFDLQDPAGALKNAELVLARDVNADGVADDGPPALAQIKATVVGVNTFAVNTSDPAILSLLQNNYGRFKVGIRTTSLNGDQQTQYSSGSVTIDGQVPAGSWLTPQSDNLVNRGTFTVSLNTVDNSADTVRVLLDPDRDPTNGNEFELLAATNVAAGNVNSTFGPSTFAIPAGTYNIYVSISDGIEPPTAFYALRPNAQSIDDPIVIRITDRLIGDFGLAQLDNSGQGYVLKGFNFNDLAGSAITRVPDLSGDGTDELLIGSRFGKPRLIQSDGVGFGEAYMIYGQRTRLRGPKLLNSVGKTVPGLIFPGVRTPRNADPAVPNKSTKWTYGMSDITAIPDMDGDGKPELVFSFPRAESITLGHTVPTIQHPELFPDLAGMGELEFDAYDYGNQAWIPNISQFSRGGIVIVSSHNSMLQNANVLSRKSDRVFDLHEVGQIFSGMYRPQLVPYVRQGLRRNDPRMGDRQDFFRVCVDCDGQGASGRQPGDLGNPADPNDDQPGACGDDGCRLGGTTLDDGKEQAMERWTMQWDVVFNNQGPGGFQMPWTTVKVSPPLANPVGFPHSLDLFITGRNQWVGGTADCPVNNCEVTNEWFIWGRCPTSTFPGTDLCDNPTWSTSGMAEQRPMPDCYPGNYDPAIIVPPDPPCSPVIPPAAPPDVLCQNPDPSPDAADGGNGAVIWTGFYPPDVQARVGTNTGEVFDTPVGARVLGQKVNDRFGTAVASDGTWLYISAPRRTANDAPYDTDVPSLPGVRSEAGVVYQLRTDAKLTGSAFTRTQLWMERGTRQFLDPNNPGADPNDPNSYVTVALTWPNVDAEIPDRTDYTMPVPHQYIIEAVGSLRGDPNLGRANHQFGNEGDTCPPPYNPTSPSDPNLPLDQPDAGAINYYQPYPVGTAGYYMDRVAQIVGPHAGSRIEFVKALGDIDGDGVRDFAVGSTLIKNNVSAGSGSTVGAVFIVFSRPSGVEGDYLLEQLAYDPSDARRLRGVIVKGDTSATDPNQNFSSAFGDAGDFNKDGFADIVIGNPGAGSFAGEAIVIFGSPTLLSPAGGWTPANIPADRAIRFKGAAIGDRAGETVSSAGDVDGDGYTDILISAPGANNGQGAVYLIYGGPSLPAVVNLGQLSTTNISVAYARFTGRGAQDGLGGGRKNVSALDPSATSIAVTSDGVAPLGDIDGDGNGDFALSSMLASPDGRTNAGEVYILYGRRGP